VLGGDRIAKVSVVGLVCALTLVLPVKCSVYWQKKGLHTDDCHSEIKVSVVVDEKYMELAVRVLHKAFDLEQANLI